MSVLHMEIILETNYEIMLLKTRSYVQYYFNNMLFEADLGRCLRRRRYSRVLDRGASGDDTHIHTFCIVRDPYGKLNHERSTLKTYYICTGVNGKLFL